MGSICLVSCGKKKQAQDTPAQDMYLSPLFTKSRTYAERHAEQWLILSAKYGLLDPNTVISPYDVTLKSMGIKDRRQWAEGVLKAILERTHPSDVLTFLTGARYHEFLVPPLQGRGYTVHLPMDHLRQGERLQWLDKQLKGA